MEIKKGFISDCPYATKYDDEGNEYRLYTLRIDNKSFNAKTPKDIYLKEGAAIVYGYEGTEILSAFCPAENTQWGPHLRTLKKHVGPYEKYTFTQGTVIEKRKESQRVNNNNSTVDESLFKTVITYTIVFENGTFRTSHDYGKDIKPQDELAVVLEENWAVLIKNHQTGKYIGWDKPYFIIGLIVFIAAFNLAIVYAQQNYPGLIVSPMATYLILNIVFGFILLSNIVKFRGKRHIKKFMQQQLKG